MTITTPIADIDELVTGRKGRWLGRRGIYRHYQPDVEKVRRRSEKTPGEVVFHTMSTAVSGEFSGKVVGELIRWVSDGDFGYEVRINGTEEHGGICDIAAYTIDDIWAVAKVANDLRYEWEQITGLHNGVTWKVL